MNISYFVNVYIDFYDFPKYDFGMLTSDALCLVFVPHLSVAQSDARSNGSQEVAVSIPAGTGKIRS